MRRQMLSSAVVTNESFVVNTSVIHSLAQYAARSKDDAVLRASSSGGVFTELARVVLAKKGVVVAAGWNRRRGMVAA